MIFDTLSRLPLVGFRTRKEYGRLRALHEEAHALLDSGGGRAFEAVPAVSGWSPAQHIHHWASISRGVLEWVCEQCDGRSDGDPGGGPNRNGYVVLLAGRIPRGRARTPAPFDPPAQPERAEVETLLRESREALDALAPCLSRLDALRVRRTHPRMGRLNPREWIRFTRIHTDHHQRIVRDVVEEQA